LDMIEETVVTSPKRTTMSRYGYAS
jgi:hypothetical protein